MSPHALVSEVLPFKHARFLDRHLELNLSDIRVRNQTDIILSWKVVAFVAFSHKDASD